MCSKWIFLLCIAFFSLTVSLAGADDENIDKAATNVNQKSTTATQRTTNKPSNAVEVTKTTVIPTTTVTGNSTHCSNGTECPGNAPTGWLSKIKENKAMLLRTLYVLIGVTSIVIIYFVVRAWRLRRRRSKSRKYGLITSRGTDLEMAPLDDDDDDDDDMTVFEHHKLRK